jgi:hypothetical protein
VFQRHQLVEYEYGEDSDEAEYDEKNHEAGHDVFPMIASQK